ncbi:MAG: hypothetical protein ABIK83_08175 [Candidatus Zixiibacteriota bacterium]
MRVEDDDFSLGNFAMGAADVAFILLFVFLFLAGANETYDLVRVPYKTEDANVDKLDTILFHISVQIDSGEIERSRMRINFRGDPQDSATWFFPNKNLGSPTFHSALADTIKSFIELKSTPPGDTLRIAVFSDVTSRYGFVAAVLAACKMNLYDCYLVFKTED